jgi:hypothetical protein
MNSLELDILIRRIPTYRIWILKYRFDDGFDTEIILPIYIPKHTVLPDPLIALP